MKQTFVANILLTEEQWWEENAAVVEKDARRLAWLVWTIQLLAELGCAAAVLAFHISSMDSDMKYLGWMGLTVHLLQGGYFIWLKSPRTRQQLRRMGFWRLLVALLGWPVNRTITGFLREMIKTRDRLPQMDIDADWVHFTLVLEIGRWASAWSLGVVLTLILFTIGERLGLVCGQVSMSCQAAMLI